MTVDSSVAPAPGPAAVDVRALVPTQRVARDVLPAATAPSVADLLDELETSWSDEPRERALPHPVRRRAARNAATAGETAQQQPTVTPAQQQPTVTPAQQQPTAAPAHDVAARQQSAGPAPAAEAAAPTAASSTAVTTPRRTGRWLDHLLTLGAVLGLLVTGVTIAATLTGLRPLVVKSGSMEPTIATGGMVLTREVTAAEIAVGDVVAVTRPDRTRVTHRVVSVVHRGATAELVLKGDANEDVDPVPVTVTTAGEVVYSAPWLGRVSAFLTSAAGGFALGCVITAVLMVVLRRRP